MVYSVAHYTLYALWLPPNALNECRKTSVRPSQFPDYIRQQQSVAYLSLSLSSTRRVGTNTWQKTMLSYLTLNLMQWEPPLRPLRAVLSFMDPPVKSVRLVTVPHFCFSPLCHVWHIMTITINRGSVKKWNVIAMVDHLILLCASCIYWLNLFNMYWLLCILLNEQLFAKILCLFILRSFFLNVFMHVGTRPPKDSLE